MYPLRMTHPQHGAMHVYSDVEREQHEAWGWSADTVEQALEQIAADAKKKRGRPKKAEA